MTRHVEPFIMANWDISGLTPVLLTVSSSPSYILTTTTTKKRLFILYSVNIAVLSWHIKHPTFGRTLVNIVFEKEIFKFSIPFP